jgi:hypothetical protein
MKVDKSYTGQFLKVQWGRGYALMVWESPLTVGGYVHIYNSARTYFISNL